MAENNSGDTRDQALDKRDQESKSRYEVWVPVAVSLFAFLVSFLAFWITLQADLRKMAHELPLLIPEVDREQFYPVIDEVDAGVRRGDGNSGASSSNNIMSSVKHGLPIERLLVTNTRVSDPKQGRPYIRVANHGDIAAINVSVWVSACGHFSPDRTPDFLYVESGERDEFLNRIIAPGAHIDFPLRHTSRGWYAYRSDGIVDASRGPDENTVGDAFKILLSEAKAGQGAAGPVVYNKLFVKIQHSALVDHASFSSNDEPSIQYWSLSRSGAISRIESADCILQLDPRAGVSLPDDSGEKYSSCEKCSGVH